MTDLAAPPPSALSPAQRIAALPDDLKAELLTALAEPDIEALERDWQFWARPNQLAPAGAWWLWLSSKGRGAGKTREGAEWVLDRSVAFHKRRVPLHRVNLIGRTAADCRDVMVEGQAGIAACADRRRIRFKYEPSKRRVTLPDLGTTMTTFSAEEPESLRGPECHTVWGDEFAAWTLKVDNMGNSAWTNAQFGLRLDPDPRAILTTTPKPIPAMRDLVKEAGDPASGVRLVQGSLRDNIANLAPQFVQTILAKYGGTALGAQEIDGLLVDRVEGALWQPEVIEQFRVKSRDDIPPLARVVVGVDPPGETVTECGIVVAGVERDPADPLRRNVYVLADESMAGEAEQWGARVIDCYRRWEANLVVGEVNHGGDMVRAIVHLQDPSIPFEKVRASDGKRLRAEPVSFLYPRGQVHHFGYLGALEAEQTTWTDAPSDPSPNRIDALVWAVTALIPGLALPPAESKAPPETERFSRGPGGYQRR